MLSIDHITGVPDEVLVMICENYDVWKLLSMTSKVLSKKLKCRFDYYPNELRIFAVLKAVSFDNGAIIGNHVSQSYSTLDDFINLMRTKCNSMQIEDTTFVYSYSVSQILPQVYALQKYNYFTLQNKSDRITILGECENNITIYKPHVLIAASVFDTIHFSLNPHAYIDEPLCKSNFYNTLYENLK